MEAVAPLPTPVPATPSLSSVLAEIGPLPREALFLGVASDGLPVLLNLHDPVPGPVLVTSDAGAGKTAFLQNIVQTVIQTHKSNDLQYGVITNHPDEWDRIERTPHCAGIFQDNAHELVLSLASWAHTGKHSKQSILLLIDDLEFVAKLDGDTLQNFRWLLARGSARRVWTFVTMNAGRYGQVLSWIPNFRTRIFGRIENDRVATALGGDKESGLDRLDAGVQFSLRENGNWLRFWFLSC